MFVTVVFWWNSVVLKWEIGISELYCSPWVSPARPTAATSLWSDGCGCACSASSSFPGAASGCSSYYWMNPTNIKCVICNIENVILMSVKGALTVNQLFIICWLYSLKLIKHLPTASKLWKHWSSLTHQYHRHFSWCSLWYQDAVQSCCSGCWVWKRQTRRIFKYICARAWLCRQHGVST